MLRIVAFDNGHAPARVDRHAFDQRNAFFTAKACGWRDQANPSREHGAAADHREHGDKRENDARDFFEHWAIALIVSGLILNGRMLNGALTDHFGKTAFIKLAQSRQ